MEAVLKKKIEIARFAKIEIPSMKEFFGTSSNARVTNEPLLYDIDIMEKIDSELRGKWINEKSPPLHTILSLYTWVKNEPTVIWDKSRYLLFYFIYLLNERERKINGGSISQLIAKSFKIKGRKISEDNVMKSFSKLLKMKQNELSDDVKLIIEKLDLILADKNSS